jgi:N-acetylneuraminate synthase
VLNLETWFKVQLQSNSPLSKPILIGEIGINHNGDLNLAKKIISLANRNGCDFVKFQKRNPDVCVPAHKKNEFKETPWGVMTYLEYKKKIEFGMDEFVEIDNHCKELGIGWSASAWDLDSQDFLNYFDVPFNKIASAMNTNIQFMERVAKERKLTFLSTGMATLDDISTAVKIFSRANCPVVLLHTISTYPAHESELNLAVINTLRDRFKIPIGYSGHESTVSPSVIAAAMGAVVIERHITSDRTMWGTDQAASLEPRGIRELANILEKLPEIVGSGKKDFTLSEKKSANNLRYW